MNILKIVKNQEGIVLSQTDVEDTISFIDSMYEGMKYKTLKEQLLKDIRPDVMNLIESLSKSGNQNADTNPTDISPFQQ